MMSDLAQLPKLPYGFADLEPVIDKETMELHYLKHHKAYVDGFNAAIKVLTEAEERRDIHTIVQKQKDIHFFGGGHLNHTFFWETLTPQKNMPVPASLEQQLTARFGSVAQFVEVFCSSVVSLQGSGWGWLVFDKQSSSLLIIKTVNQDIVPEGVVPLLGIDLWEHAYYLKYQNRRIEYLKSIFSIINWEKVAERLVVFV